MKTAENREKQPKTARNRVGSLGPLRHRSGYHRFNAHLSVAFCFMGASGVQYWQSHCSHSERLNGVAKCCFPLALRRPESHALKNTCPPAPVPWTGRATFFLKARYGTSITGEAGKAHPWGSITAHPPSEPCLRKIRSPLQSAKMTLLRRTQRDWSRIRDQTQRLVPDPGPNP